MAADPPTLTQAQRLETALGKRGYSVREFAKILAGPDATRERWESERRNLQRWLAGQPMFPKSARKVAAALGEPAENWVIPRQARAADEQIENLEQRVDALEGQLREVATRLSELLAVQRDLGEGPSAHRATPD